jgi:hypothetical protein
MMIRLAWFAPALALLGGCAPAERVAGPLGWPKQWEGRSLWATPHATIYAGSGAAAGELDRVAARAKREYAAELGQPTPPVLIIVRDAGEPLPGNDLGGLLRRTLRMEIERNPDAVAEGESPEAPSQEEGTTEAPERTLDQQTEEALTALWAGALATGSTLEVLAGTIPLTCDARGLREICHAPEGPGDQTCGAVILPTRACLRTHARRTMQGALKMYGIGPVAQALFAPVLVMAEAKMVDRLDRLRDAVLCEHWLFEHADLPPSKKREIASAWRERWGGRAEEAAMSVAGAATEQ